jgi:alpha-D-ribose 1-methylphosphonate 5-triphosphate synthase subunit PhnH
VTRADVGRALGSLVRPDPATARLAFRAVLDALARPGTPTRLPALPGVPPALVPLLALADLDTPFCLLGASPELIVELSADVAVATGAPAAELAAARFVAALGPIGAAEFGALRPGSAAAPEEAALGAVAVPAVVGGPELSISGPGVVGRGVLAATGLPVGWSGVRRAVAFPAGADLLFVDPSGACVGIPRSTRVED